MMVMVGMSMSMIVLCFRIYENYNDVDENENDHHVCIISIMYVLP
jgi:hypothetical protein